MTTASETAKRLSEEAARQQAINQLKGRVIRGTATGAGIAGGAAATDLVLAGAGYAAEATVAVVEGIAVVPTVLTIAAVGATGYGVYRGVKALRKWWNSPVSV